MKIKFSDMNIKNLPILAVRKIYMSDKESGFGIRVNPSGTKVFVYRYKMDKKREFYSIGEYPQMTLAQAREKYQKYSSGVKLNRRGSKDGFDPALERLTAKEIRIAEKTKKANVKTLEDLVTDYIDVYAKTNKKSWKEDERILQKELVQKYGKLKLTDITSETITNVLDSIIKRGSFGMANNTFKTMRKLFNWATDIRKLFQITPCYKMKLPSRENEKDRYLSASEIYCLWNNFDNLVMSKEIKWILKLILVTAQRPVEVTSMHTKELTNGQWIIPAEKSKNGKLHIVHLTKTAQQIISDAIDFNKFKYEISSEREYDGYIFPCPHRAKIKPIHRNAVSSAVLENLSDYTDESNGKVLNFRKNNPDTNDIAIVKKFTPHDLRRTAATFMAENGELDEVIDAVLNHVKKGVIRRYNLYTYDKEKQAALEKWEDKLINIVSKINCTSPVITAT